MKNIVEQVKEKMARLLSDREKAVNDLKDKITAAQAELEAARIDKDKAAEAMSKKAFEDANQREQMALANIRINSEKLKELTAAELIGEEESRAVIESVREYRQELEKALRDKAAPHVEALNELKDKYEADRIDAENVLNEWTKNIRANYWNDLTLYFDEETGEYSHISKTPVPLFRESAVGCETSAAINSFTRRFEENIRSWGSF